MANKKKEEETKTKSKPKNEDKELSLILDKINKDFGEGSVMMLGAKPVITGNTVSSGSFGLNIALGIGGYPKGRIIEIYGPESSGKTTLVTTMIAEAQKEGGRCAIIDSEYAFDVDYARKLGVDVDALLISQPATTEQALEIADRLAESGKFAVVAIDSVAAMVPKKELEGEMDESSMGIQARLMSKILRKITGTVSKTNTILVFVNQLREKIGVMFGNPETTTGGNALKFYASVRLDIRRTSTIKDGEESIGSVVKVKVAKNKLAPPFKTVEFNIIWGEGIDVPAEVIESAIKFGVASRAGSWFVYNDTKVANGRENTKKFLLDNEEVYQEIKEKILIKIKELNT